MPHARSATFREPGNSWSRQSTSGWPVLKDQATQQCGGGDGGVVGAGELGVGKQGVEEAAGEVVAFDLSGALDGVEQGLE